ncbi:MAG: hypothetical protein FWD59_06545, partial [Micrococcales bacterium]|nr:hypothetical protein [Micrococcales bacterium]
MAFIPIPNCSGFATVTLTSVEPLTPPDTAQKGAAEKLSVSLRSLSGNKVAVKVAGKGVKQPVGKVTVRFGKVAKTYQLKAKANGRLTVKIPAKAIKASKTGA